MLMDGLLLFRGALATERLNIETGRWLHGISFTTSNSGSVYSVRNNELTGINLLILNFIFHWDSLLIGRY